MRTVTIEDIALLRKAVGEWERTGRRFPEVSATSLCYFRFSHPFESASARR